MPELGAGAYINERRLVTIPAFCYLCGLYWRCCGALCCLLFRTSASQHVLATGARGDRDDIAGGASCFVLAAKDTSKASQARTRYCYSSLIQLPARFTISRLHRSGPVLKVTPVYAPAGSQNNIQA